MPIFEDVASGVKQVLGMYGGFAKEVVETPKNIFSTIKSVVNKPIVYEKPEVKQPSFDRKDFARRIRRVETGEASEEQATTTVGVTGDLGTYQANPKTLKDWGEAWLGKKYTSKEFLNNKEAQHTFFNEFMNVAERYNLAPEEAAVAWHRGWGELGTGPRETREQRFRKRLQEMMNEDISKSYLEKYHE